MTRDRWYTLPPAGHAGGRGRARLAAVSLVAVVQMTSHISQASTPGQQANTTGLVTGSDLKPGQRLAIGTGLSWESWMPQAFEISWTQLEFFDAASQPPPPGATVVEVAWPTDQPPRTAGRRHRPAGGS